MAAAETKSLQVLVKFFLVLVSSSVVGGAGDSAHTAAGIHVHFTCVSVALHVACKVPRGRGKMTDHPGGVLWSRLAGMAQTFHPGSVPQTLISAREAKIYFSCFPRVTNFGKESFCLLYQYFRLSRLHSPSLGRYYFLYFQYIFPFKNSQNFCLSLFPVLS